MAFWVVHIENYRPYTVNELLGTRNIYARASMKQSDAQMIGYMCHSCKVPKATGKRSVSVEMTCHKGRGLDQDAVQKSLLDALVKSGMLVDDSSLWLDFRGVTIKRGKMKATTITLEDVE